MHGVQGRLDSGSPKAGLHACFGGGGYGFDEITE
jgi:hypothetical protein